MARVDELTLSFVRDGEDWTYGLDVEAKEGVDLLDALRTLLDGVELPDLPPIRVHQVRARHGAQGTSVSSTLALTDSSRLDLRRLPLVGEDAGERAWIGFETLTLGLARDPGGVWSTAFGGTIVFAGEPHQLALTTTGADGAERPGPHVLQTSKTFGPLTVDSVAVDVDLKRVRVQLNAPRRTRSRRAGRHRPPGQRPARGPRQGQVLRRRAGGEVRHPAGHDQRRAADRRRADAAALRRLAGGARRRLRAGRDRLLRRDRAAVPARVPAGAGARSAARRTSTSTASPAASGSTAS